MKVNIVSLTDRPLPHYHTEQAAGVDLVASLSEPVTLGSLERAIIPTGICIALPTGYEAQVRPRSGLAAKHGVSIANAPGTIDADYRGEIRAVLINLSKDDYTIHDGDRVAQLVIAKCEQAEWEPVETLEETVRGQEGFGHTGKK